MEIIKGGFSISTDRARLDLRFIHDYLSKESYWAGGIPYEKVVAAADHSLNFGLYHGNRQIGYARIVTDYARVAYLADVFVIGEYRGQGLSKWLIQQIMLHLDLRGLKRWMLHTRDAHGLYTQYGWDAATKPETYMEISNPAAEWCRLGLVGGGDGAIEADGIAVDKGGRNAGVAIGADDEL